MISVPKVAGGIIGYQLLIVVLAILAKNAVDTVFGADSAAHTYFFWVFSVLLIGTQIGFVAYIVTKFHTELFGRSDDGKTE